MKTNPQKIKKNRKKKFFFQIRQKHLKCEEAKDLEGYVVLIKDLAENNRWFGFLQISNILNEVSTTFGTKY